MNKIQTTKAGERTQTPSAFSILQSEEDARREKLSWLQEMADIAQDAGMHPDKINAVCMGC